MDGRDRRDAPVRRRLGPADRRQDRLGAGRRLRIGGKGAVVQFLARCVPELGGSEEAAHVARLAAEGARPEAPGCGAVRLP